MCKETSIWCLLFWKMDWYDVFGKGSQTDPVEFSVRVRRWLLWGVPFEYILYLLQTQSFGQWPFHHPNGTHQFSFVPCKDFDRYSNLRKLSVRNTSFSPVDFFWSRNSPFPYSRYLRLLHLRVETVRPHNQVVLGDGRLNKETIERKIFSQYGDTLCHPSKEFFNFYLVVY